MDTEDENVVQLTGRVTGEGEPVTLPSGDIVHTVRVTVRRPARRAARRVTVDAVDVACWTSATRRVAGRLRTGDRVEVEGSLRRRFFRSGSGAPASRYEVEATAVRKVTQATEV
ncbi:single-stranded DNA-binding protein [Phycicoccus sp. CSK15P-2]|uniref:single-stranded DNA-binding protein n=1 Tax=Phycicoccus sp. CSK15P-2 TaxID=2807627 RepID=UPI0019523385|nr:single-stranded DNA-binding protein [Phycicoccus sp. CSK15P-2]MBM6405778.1 single-stranded DNA-binding protein [Phycicoccus sp. CSK15P-2]